MRPITVQLCPQSVSQNSLWHHMKKYANIRYVSRPLEKVIFTNCLFQDIGFEATIRLSVPSVSNRMPPPITRGFQNILNAHETVATYPL